MSEPTARSSSPLPRNDRSGPRATVPDADDTTVVDDVEEADGRAAEGDFAVSSRPKRSARNSSTTTTAPSSRPRSTTKPKAQPSGGAATLAVPGAESRRAEATRPSHSGVGRLTMRTRHGRSGGYWTTTTPRGR